jgi:molybdate transport system permease protein
VDFAPLVLSFEVATLATLLAGAVGIATGALLASPRVPGRDLADVLVTAPMILPPTVLGYYLLVALGRSSPIGHAFEALTGSPIVFTRTGAVVAAFLEALPFVIKASRAALEEVDPRLLGAARTLGASPLHAFFTVALPLARTGIASGLTLGFARALGDFGVTLMVAGNIPGVTRTAALAIYDAVEGNRDAEAHGLVVTLTAIAMLALYAANKLARRSRRG